MMKETSKARKALVSTYEKGYRVDEKGNVISSVSGNFLKPFMCGKYLSFKVVLKGERFSVYIHRLQAYQKYGAKMLEDGVQVRHYNGNIFDNSWKNILIGTDKQNKADSIRNEAISNGERHGSAIRKAKLKTSKFSREDIKDIYLSKNRQVDLAKRYNTRQARISEIKRGVIWSNITKNLSQSETPVE